MSFEPNGCIGRGSSIGPHLGGARSEDSRARDHAGPARRADGDQVDPAAYLWERVGFCSLHCLKAARGNLGTDTSGKLVCDSVLVHKP